jgi:DNA-nicking Smr family endonuclease
MAEQRKTPVKPDQVSEQDRDLWQHVKGTTKPLTGRKPLHREDLHQESGEAQTRIAKTKKPGPPHKAAPPSAPVPPSAPDLAPGALADVDKRTAERLRRGMLAIEGLLDLHRMTQDEAEQAVRAFLVESQAAGRRCVLIVTGKGAGPEGGVLRRELPRWLNLPANRARLVAFAPAQPQHGGHGAVYLLLKRRRREP